MSEHGIELNLPPRRPDFEPWSSFLATWFRWMEPCLKFLALTLLFFFFYIYIDGRIDWGCSLGLYWHAGERKRMDGCRDKKKSSRKGKDFLWWKKKKNTLTFCLMDFHAWHWLQLIFFYWLSCWLQMTLEVGVYFGWTHRFHHQEVTENKIWLVLSLTAFSNAV